MAPIMTAAGLEFPPHAFPDSPEHSFRGLRAPGRGGAGRGEGGRGPDSLRRDGQPLRPEPHRRTAGVRIDQAPRERPARCPPDGPAGRPPGPGLRQGGRQHHQLPPRGLRPRRSHALAHPRARLQGGAGVQSGDAARLARPRARQSRSRAAHVGEPRVRRPAVHPVGAAEDRRGAPAHRRHRAGHLARGRRRDQGREHRRSRRSGRRHLRRRLGHLRRQGLRRDHPRHARAARRGIVAPPCSPSLHNSRSSPGVAGAAGAANPIASPRGSGPRSTKAARQFPSGARVGERFMTELEFQKLASQGYTRIPVFAEARADLYTPLALYGQLANGPYSYLLESVVGGERFGRYSFIGLACSERIEARGRRVRRLLRDARGADVCLEERDDDPFDYARAWLERERTATLPAALRFGGGLVGYFGYEAVRHIEQRALSREKPDPLGTPDALLLVSDELAVVDNALGKLTLVVYADPRQPGAFRKAVERLEELRHRLARPLPEALVLAQPAAEPPLPGPLERTMDERQFLEAVRRAKD